MPFILQFRVISGSLCMEPDGNIGAVVNLFDILTHTQMFGGYYRFMDEICGLIATNSFCHFKTTLA